jgi:hypothetical protein
MPASAQGFVMSDLRDIGAAIEAHPDIAGVKRRVPDECIDRLTWTVWLIGAWRSSDAGHGATIEEAYQDALSNRAALQVAA